MKTEIINKKIEIYICEKCGTKHEYSGDIFICQQCNQEKCTTCSTRETVERDNLDMIDTYPTKYRTICGECYSKNYEIEITREMRGYLYQIDGQLYRHTNKFTEDELMEIINKSATMNKNEDNEYGWDYYFECHYGFKCDFPDISIKFNT